MDRSRLMRLSLKTLAWWSIPAVVLAATLWPYFPPPGITYTQSAGQVNGAATGGAQGAGTINATGLFVNGAAVSTGSATGANPTGTVGLTAVNGAAGTFLRSDGAPPLSQSISPTWTGTHTFNGPVVVGSATGGSQGSGTLNVASLFVNGVAQPKFAAAQVTSNCTVLTSAINVASVSLVSTGKCNMKFTTGYFTNAAGPNCAITLFTSPLLLTSVVGPTDNTQLTNTIYTPSGGTPTNAAFNFVCVGT